MRGTQIIRPTDDQVMAYRYGVDQGAQTLRIHTRAEIEVNNGRIEAYAAFLRQFNQHNDFYQPGSFQQAIRERFDEPEVSKIKVMWLHDAPLAVPSELREDSTGLWTVTDIPDPDGINREKVLLIEEGVVDGLSIEFARRSSDWRYLGITEYDEEDLGAPVSWWTEPRAYSRVDLRGYSPVFYPSADDARIRALRDIQRHVGRDAFAGWHSLRHLPLFDSKTPQRREKMPADSTPDTSAADELRALREEMAAEREAIAAERRAIQEEREFNEFSNAVPDRTVNLRDLPEQAVRMLFSARNHEGFSAFLGATTERPEEDATEQRTSGASYWGQAVGTSGSTAPGEKINKREAMAQANREFPTDAVKAEDRYKELIGKK